MSIAGGTRGSTKTHAWIEPKATARTRVGGRECGLASLRVPAPLLVAEVALRYDFVARARRQSGKHANVDCLLEEMDRAVAESEVRAGGMERVGFAGSVRAVAIAVRGVLVRGQAVVAGAHPVDIVAIRAVDGASAGRDRAVGGGTADADIRRRAVPSRRRSPDGPANLTSTLFARGRAGRRLRPT